MKLIETSFRSFIYNGRVYSTIPVSNSGLPVLLTIVLEDQPVKPQPVQVSVLTQVMSDPLWFLKKDVQSVQQQLLILK
jgi:hypothetical protein